MVINLTLKNGIILDISLISVAPSIFFNTQIGADLVIEASLHFSIFKSFYSRQFQPLVLLQRFFQSLLSCRTKLFSIKFTWQVNDCCKAGSSYNVCHLHFLLLKPHAARGDY